MAVNVLRISFAMPKTYYSSSHQLERCIKYYPLICQRWEQARTYNVYLASMIAGNCLHVPPVTLITWLNNICVPIKLLTEIFQIVRCSGKYLQ